MGDADRVRRTTYMFINDASLWWEGVEHVIDLTTLSWAQFKEIFYEKYFSADVRGPLKREFISLCQGDTTVAEFVRKFERDCHFVPLISRDPAEKMRHFMDGLRPAIRRDVMMMRLVDYAAATTYAFQAEQALKDIDFEVHRKRCFICKEEGHKADDCPKKKAHTMGRTYVMHAEEAEEESDTTFITGNLVIERFYIAFIA
ncbi:uncharacterized protein LOC142537547 [Primulina tabacum]|uniref:uncharacterized protein LOC142537547 n=1 Tax=Primulina tabacum TaxID=48773 RepID=UPI003F59AC62